MTVDQSEDWMKRQAAALGARVRRVRLAKGMSVQAVADRATNDLGYKMLRTTLANLEAGARRNVTLGEVSVLAEALDVPPLGLLFPIDEPATVEVLPGVHRTPWDAWRWFADGLGYFDMEYEEPKSPAAQEIRTAMGHYSALTVNGQVWARTNAMIQSLAAMNRDNDEAQESLKKEMEHILADTHGALQYLEERSLPIPDLPAKWLAELRRNDLEIAQMDSNRADGLGTDADDA